MRDSNSNVVPRNQDWVSGKTSSFFKCDDCNEIVARRDVDRVQDPKPGSRVVWNICPECRSANTLRAVCDHPECLKVVSCGWPSEIGYRLTCDDHFKAELIPDAP